MALVPGIGFDELSGVFEYDAEAGKLFWKVAPNRKSKIGSEAGSIKNARTAGKEPKRYLYVTYEGWSTTAARVAWLLTYKEWPKNNLLYVDGDTLNIRIANLKLGDFCSGPQSGEPRQKKMTREAQRHYGLKRYYGLTMESYGRMMEEQGGVCAICKLPEVRVTPKGDVTTLHVDHDHETNKVRSLLCYRCNSALGSMRDDPDLLIRAAEYIKRHRASRGSTEWTS